MLVTHCQCRYVVSGIGGSIVSDAPETVNYISLEETYKLSWGELDSRFRFFFVCGR